MRLGSIEEFAVGGESFEEGCSLLSFCSFLNAYLVYALLSFVEGEGSISGDLENTCRLRALRGVNPKVEPVGVSVLAFEFKSGS